MFRRFLKLASALVLVVAVSAPDSALALPVATIRFSPKPTITVGKVVTFDGTLSICDFPPCRYIWSWRYPSGVTGGRMGEGRVIRYAFPASAGGRTVAVVLKVVANTKTHGFGTATARIAVKPAPAATTPPT